MAVKWHKLYQETKKKHLVGLESVHFVLLLDCISIVTIIRNISFLKNANCVKYDNISYYITV